ncbi:MAG: Gfo/Idh/MocA family oxidoreductase [Prolixibacteraceae bacterium]|nr:Gfo/Idh/MocA family oxidoreductase [Prolixibacteraceae bacterium]
MKRRNFIRTSSLATAGLITALHVPAFAAQEKLKIGLIGCGWYGMVDINAALKTGKVEVVAICDVDTDHLKTSADQINTSQGSRPKEFKDYKELLNTPGLNAVFIATPPHWHALMFIAACEKGLDVYCEKPLAYDVREGQAMVNAAQKAGNIVQVGFQRRQSKAFQKAKELVEEGRIGKINNAAAQIHYNPDILDNTVQTPPETLDWDAWCGPAPKLDYRPNIAHNAWRLEKEYGNGHFVDWGIHNIDALRIILGLDIPVEFNTNGKLSVLKDKITTPDTLNAYMEFEQCPVVWQHRMWGPGEVDRQFNNGIFLYGENGTIFSSDSRLVLMPTGRGAQQEIMDLRTPEMQDNQVSGFIEAVLSNNKNLLTCTVEDAFKSTATVQLAMISYYNSQPVKWDAAKNEIIDNQEAAKLLARPYRKGYKRPEV